jgi:glycosyltransferase involved in cell wall biosynthesis
VAIVAPSLRILGGQSVQADRLLTAWRDDPDVDAWLVPHNPQPPRPLRFANDVRYLRTLVTETLYLPLLVRELARADVVHVFSASYFSFLLAPLPALAVARALGKPAILNYHSGEAPDHLRRSAIARRVLARVDCTIVPSPFLVDVFAQFNLRAAAIPNIIDLDRFRFRLRDPLRPRILSTRNFEPHYNVACTLRAFQLVQARRPDASLTLVGAGSEESRLRSLAAELRLRNVTFAGRVAPDEVHRWYADHDMYVQSPDIDNMPLSVVEAYASGLPVVATNVGGVPTIVTSGVHGILVPPNDHAALATEVLRLLDEPALARRLAQAASAFCGQWTWSAVRGQWLDVYRSAARPERSATTAAAAGCSARTAGRDVA